MTSNKTYTASDFERYYNGSMPSGEMHALERAALEDPFLADALEGYAFTRSPVKDINDLRLRIYEKKHDKKVISLFTKTGWWRVAALLAIVIGGTYLFLLLNRTKQTGSVAVSTGKQSTHDTQLSVATGDTSLVNSIASADESPQPKTGVNKSAKAEGIASQSSRREEKSEPGPVENLKQNVSPDTMKFTAAAMDKVPDKIAGKIPSKKYFLKGRVVDEKGAPVIAARVQNKNSGFFTITDNSGNFMLPSDDSAAVAVVSAVGYDSKSTQLQKNAHPRIRLVPSNRDLAEVVVDGYSASNKSAAPEMSKMLNSKAAGVVITDSLGDYQRFNSYLRIYKQNLYDSNNVQMTGEVTLSFNVDEDGFPEDIQVLKSTCKGCEENAIGLLKKGPTWSRKNKKHTVSIKY